MSICQLKMVFRCKFGPGKFGGISLGQPTTVPSYRSKILKFKSHIILYKICILKAIDKKVKKLLILLLIFFQ
jgi:hypothetical protein